MMSFAERCAQRIAEIPEIFRKELSQEMASCIETNSAIISVALGVK